MTVAISTACVAGCSASAHQSDAPRSTQPGDTSVSGSGVYAAAPPPPLLDAVWRAHTLPSHSLRVHLPEGANWTTGADGTFWRAEHDLTRSTLLLKRWREGTLVDAHDCEQQAELWKPSVRAPDVVGSASTTLRILTDYHSRITTYVTRSADDVVRGTLIAHGANVRDCFSFWFTTEATLSPQSEAVVRTRMQVMQMAIQRIDVTTAAERIVGPAGPGP